MSTGCIRTVMLMSLRALRRVIRETAMGKRIVQGTRVTFTSDDGELEGVVNGFNPASGEAYVEVPGLPDADNTEHELPLDELTPIARR